MQQDAAVTGIAHVHEELGTLSRRASMINVAITFCTATALLVCAVIAALFLGAFAHCDATIAVAMLFVGATATFFSVCFRSSVRTFWPLRAFALARTTSFPTCEAMIPAVALSASLRQIQP